MNRRTLNLDDLHSAALRHAEHLRGLIESACRELNPSTDADRDAAIRWLDDAATLATTCYDIASITLLIGHNEREIRRAFRRPLAPVL